MNVASAVGCVLYYYLCVFQMYTVCVVRVVTSD